jgi:glycosyltransferase involved in cell wall biosynthesis
MRSPVALPASVQETLSRRTSALRLAVVTNIPAPYRVPVYNRIAADPDFEFLAIYAAQREPDRKWDLPTLEHRHVFLSERMIERGGRFIHHNPDVWGALAAFRPDVVVTTGFNPTHLIAWAYTLVHRCRHVAMTDGTDQSEAKLSVLHRLVRRLVFITSSSFVVASQGGRRLLRRYGVSDSRIHSSPLCANTAVDWTEAGVAERDIDLLFSGRLVGIKNAGFALDVAAGVATRLGRRVHLALLGDGPLAPDLRRQAAALADRVQVTFAGHVAQTEIPGWFMRSHLFLFPSQWDPWGVVANEACLAGVPVLVSPHAGVADELVREGVNGRVLPLESSRWVEAAVELLSDQAIHARMAAAAREAVQPYNFDNAAFGITDAAAQACPRVHAPQRRSTL